MSLDHYVKANKDIIQFVKNAVPGAVDKYVGTLDYATARFNTILIIVSQDRILEEVHKADVEECFNTIQDFYNSTKKLITWPWVFKPLMKIRLHTIGTKRIPAIKRLLNRLENNNHFYHRGDDTV